jgi:hypothetical protein
MKRLFYFKNPELMLACYKEAPSVLDGNDYVEVNFKIPNNWTLQKIFDFFNQEDNPLAKPEGQEWIRKVGLHHTSMSVGDVVEIDGIPNVCMPTGWKPTTWED